MLGAPSTVHDATCTDRKGTKLAEQPCPECGHPGPHLPLGSGLVECADPECGRDCGMVFQVDTDKRTECGCHGDECTTEPHDCERPCRWPSCLTEAEHAQLLAELEREGL